MDTDHSPLRSRWFVPGVAFVALVVGFVAGGLGTAGAKEHAPVPPMFDEGPFPGPDAVFWKGPGRPGIALGFGPGGGIHSEVTHENGEGKYRTTATQLGKVVSVSPTSITLESDDGYERTYAVSEDTVVTAGRDGIDDLKDGDTVHLAAEVEGSEARAVRIVDAAAMKLGVGRIIEDKGNS